MKGMTGVMIAVALGLVGALANWVYVANTGRDIATLEFVAIKQDTALEPGDTFREEHLELVEVPRNRAGNLEGRAVSWDAKETLYGYAVTREFTGGEIVLVEDTRTAARRSAAQRLLREDEIARGVQVDSRSFVTRLINPGDLVAFTLASPAGGGPRTLGPFEVLYLGSRGSSSELARVAGGSGDAESIVTIRVRMKNPPPTGNSAEDREKRRNWTWDGQLEDRAQQLFDVVHASNQPAGITLFSEELANELRD